MDPSSVESFLLSLLLAGCTLILIRQLRFMDAQRKYEEEFMIRHRDIVERHRVGRPFTPNTGVIRLTFPPRDTEHLLGLCKHAFNRWTLRYYLTARDMRTREPTVQVHYLGFRTVPLDYRAIAIEVIRCNENYALIGAEDGAGYVLEKWGLTMDPRYPVQVFYIHTKFKYRPGAEPARNGDNVDEATHQNQDTTDMSLATAAQTTVRRRTHTQDQGE